jgi:hypothetical protein
MSESMAIARGEGYATAITLFIVRAKPCNGISSCRKREREPTTAERMCDSSNTISSELV